MSFNVNQLYMTIAQNVVMSMLMMRVIPAPELKSFADDKGILENFVKQHTTDREILNLKKDSKFTYMYVCGMHAFGAGIYAAFYQTKLKKALNDFTAEEIATVENDLYGTDAYELGLSGMGLDANSNNKKVFDQIIMTAIKSAMQCAGEETAEPEGMKELMKVLYNAGITVFMRQ